MNSTEKCGRIRIVLSDFYSDHRQKAFVFLYKEWTKIQELEEHIQKMFRINCDIYLTVEDCLIPSEEHMDVISEADTIVVHRVQLNQLPQLTNAFSQARINSAPETTPDIGTSEMSSPLFDKSQFKKRKRDGSGEDRPPKKCSKWIQDINSLDCVGDIASTVTGNTIMEVSDVKPKRHRTRKRKNKKGNETSSNNSSQSTKSSILGVESSSYTAAVPKVQKKCHIRFQDEGISVVEEKVLVSGFVEESTLPTGPARVIRAACTKVKTEFGSAEKISASQKSENESTEKSNEVERKKPITHAIIEIAEPQIVLTQFNNAESPISLKDGSALEALRRNVGDSNLKMVTGSINTNDVLAFKIITLTENYMPEMSEYIIGWVKTVDDVSDTCTVTVLAGADVIKEPTGKFSMELEADVVSDVDKLLTLQRCEILDARYVPVADSSPYF